MSEREDVAESLEKLLKLPSPGTREDRLVWEDDQFTVRENPKPREKE